MDFDQKIGISVTALWKRMIVAWIIINLLSFFWW